MTHQSVGDGERDARVVRRDVGVVAEVTRRVARAQTHRQRHEPAVAYTKWRVHEVVRVYTTIIHEYTYTLSIHRDTRAYNSRTQHQHTW